MKSVAAFALLSGGASATSVNHAHLAEVQSHSVALSTASHNHHNRHFRQSTVARAFFGDTACPCIGFDNIEGETTVDFENGIHMPYPADLGARCEEWDDGRHPACKEGETPGLGNGWCGQKWCYVDSCNCDIPVLPKVSSYVPDARYRGRPVFFSYATCGAQDSWSSKLPEVGSAGCRCIGFDDIAGTTDVTMKLAGGGTQTVSYPAEIGGSCTAWDDGVHPECRSKDPPKWCAQKWCYVDPCSCDIGSTPKVTMYLPEATFTGKSLYYSYDTCGSKDYFTEKYNTDACVNQENEKTCLKLTVRGGGNKCAWTGSTCVGWEIVEHPLCKDVVQTLKKEKSAASPITHTSAVVAIAASVGAVATVSYSFEM